MIQEKIEKYSEQDSDAKRIEWLLQEVKRVKRERNDFHMDLLKLRVELNKTKAELTLLESYVNRIKDVNKKRTY